jgi:hypothetical protein
MKSISKQIRKLIGGLSLLAYFAALWPVSAPAQPAFDSANTPHVQRNALNSVRSHVNWLQNSTRTASNFGEQGYGSVRRSFEELRLAYVALTQALTPQQSAHGANDLAELNTGLDIIQEAFTYYEDDVAAGKSPRAALANLCRVLRQDSTLWLQELNKTSFRLQIGLA